MRVLILESISGLHGGVNSKLFPEGFAMLRTMAKEFSEAGFDVIVPLNRGLKPLAKWLDARVLFTRGRLDDCLNQKPDAALVIAPEKERELELITTRLRESGINVIGSGEEAIRVSANKWLTYLSLKGKVPQPKTWKEPPAKGRILVKPLDGVSCEGIRVLDQTHIPVKNVIFQEFLGGEHASCCLLISDGKGEVLSVNKQEIVNQGSGFEYMGGEIPLGHELKKKCAEIALRAAEVLNLRGYCGVDLILRGRPYFIESNPRVTTSFIGLARVSRVNLAKLLVRALNGDSFKKPKLRGYSIIKIPVAKNHIWIDARKLDEIFEIPEMIAPPFASDGYLKKGSPVFLVTGFGSNIRRARCKLTNAIEETLSILGVDRNAIAWS